MGVSCWNHYSKSGTFMTIKPCKADEDRCVKLRSSYELNGGKCYDNKKCDLMNNFNILHRTTFPILPIRMSTSQIQPNLSNWLYDCDCTR